MSTTQSVGIKMKQGMLVGTFVLSAIALLLITMLKLSEISQSFSQYDEGGVEIETYLLKISAQTNYISRVTRSIMLGDDFDTNLRALDERTTLIVEHFAKTRAAAEKINDPSKREHFHALIQQAQGQTIEFIKDGRDQVAALKDYPAAEKAAAWPAYHKTATPLANKARASFKELVDYSAVTLKESKEQVNDAIKLLIILLPVGAGVMIVISTVSGYLIIKKLLQQLGGEPEIAVHVAQQIAAGNLSTPIDVSPDDDASLLRAMQKMQASLSQTIRQICQDAEKLNQAANDVMASTKHLTGNTLQQSDAASSMAAAIEEITVSIQSVAKNSEETFEVAKEAGNLSVDGEAIVHSANAEMEKIADSVNASSESIKILGEHSKQISEIANVIKEIADQTNLLALNAAIEAARAGEQGRGFAVVADEVRKLAERTTQSTQEISTMIASIQHGTLEAVQCMTQGRERVGVGVEMISKAGCSMRDINVGADRVITSVSDIRNALQEQSATSQQVATSVEKVAQMASDSNIEAKYLANMSVQLGALASSLREHVRHFQITG